MVNLLALSLAILSLSFVNISPPSWQEEEWPVCHSNSLVPRPFPLPVLIACKPEVGMGLPQQHIYVNDLLTSESGWWCGVARESCAGSLWGGEKGGGCFGEAVGAGGEGWVPGEVLAVLNWCNCCFVCSLNWRTEGWDCHSEEATLSMASDIHLWNFSEASSDFNLWISSFLITASERSVRSCSTIDNL